MKLGLCSSGLERADSGLSALTMRRLLKRRRVVRGISFFCLRLQKRHAAADPSHSSANQSFSPRSLAAEVR